MKDSSLVHVARDHIHLFEHLEAKGMYLVSAAEFKMEDLYDLIAARCPEFKLPSPDSWKGVIAVKLWVVSTKRLAEAGFKYENGLEEMFDGAIRVCKEKGLL